MEKKDIIIYSLVVVALAISIYRRYAKKKAGGATVNDRKPTGKRGLSGQPDDYEPYSGDKSN